MAAKLGRLALNNTAFLLCDIQEKFRPSIRYFPEIIKVAQRMVSYLWKTVNISNKPDCKQLVYEATKGDLRNFFWFDSTAVLMTRLLPWLPLK